MSACLRVRVQQVQTVDFFRTFLDDPYTLGRVAAVHALGDCWAMGAEPVAALAIAQVPFGLEDTVEEDLYQMMSGAAAALREAKCALAGGHSCEGQEMALGASCALRAVRCAALSGRGGRVTGGAALPALREHCFRLLQTLSRFLREGADLFRFAHTHSSSHSTPAFPSKPYPSCGKKGFSVHGAVRPGEILRKSGLAPGHALILTKPVGTGVIFAADMRAKASGQSVEAALASMVTQSGAAAAVLRAHGAAAATDVTGFGLLGHLVRTHGQTHGQTPHLDGGKAAKRSGLSALRARA